MRGAWPLGRLWLLGCGTMGRALFQRWDEANLASLTVIDPGVHGALAEPPVGAPDIVVLAVKPQGWHAACAPLTLGPATLVISVMAGVTCAALGARFPGARIVRTMPNTAARLGLGVTALFGDGLSEADMGQATRLMAAAGTCVWLDREADFDAVTAVSGSGPAYVFAFIEALAAAGVAAGLSPHLSSELAMRTATGAAALAAEPDAEPSLLRQAVTSAGGTTAAGLAVLSGGLPELLRATVAAAQSRSRELGRLE